MRASGLGVKRLEMTALGAYRETHPRSGSILSRVTQYHSTEAPAYTSGVADTFADRLRSLRTRRRLSPSELAYAVGVTEGAIRQMESGQTKSASFMIGLKLANVLGVTAWFLATGRDDPPETVSPAHDRSAGSLLERVEKLERQLVQINAKGRRVKASEGQRRAGTRRKAPE
jgi:transcriptional regulator with XRE-family HTH domain